MLKAKAMNELRLSATYCNYDRTCFGFPGFGCSLCNEQNGLKNIQLLDVGQDHNLVLLQPLFRLV